MEKGDIAADEQEPASFFHQEKQHSKFAAFCLRHKKLLGAICAAVMLLPLLGLLALAHGTKAEYTSPLILPSPEGYGPGNWADAYAKARALVGKMKPEEMNNITVGFSTEHTGCVGISGSAPAVGFPGLCLHDAGNGVRNTDGVNGYAAGLHIGASWNVSLANQRATYMGAEFKKKGVNVALGPVVGPIGRIAEGGRNWEGFAADPYLDGVLGAQTINGLQQSVIACVKHFIANEQETDRTAKLNHGNIVTQASSSNVDDRTMHELYIWPFQDAVYAGVGSVMCSYNRINQTYGCENSKAMNAVLKGELNFQGFVVSDWKAQHSGLLSAEAGLDMAMPMSPCWDDDQLAKAVQNGSLNGTRLSDMATRIVATWYQLGQDDPDYPAIGLGMPPNLLAPHTFVDARDPDAKGSILEQAIEGHVLVKNTNNALPLKKMHMISVFGYDATVQPTFNPGQPQFDTNKENVGLELTDTGKVAQQALLSNTPSKAQGTLLVGGGSGSNTPAYISSPYDALQAKAYDDGTSIFFDFTSTQVSVAADSEACLVFINEYASEGFDRPGLADEDSDDLVNSVASQCANTIVVIHNAGVRLVDSWIDNDNVTAVIFAHLPGQDAGRSIVPILYGDVSPSGRLPYTVAKKPGDYGDLQGPCIDHSSSPQCDYTEGVNIDYRGFLARDKTPRFEFGFGLTYSSFAYSGLSIDMNATSTAGAASKAGVYTNGTTDQNIDRTDVGVGGLLALFEDVGTISATIQNNGSVSAAEVAQLYLEIPTPPDPNIPSTKALRGFQKIQIDPGASEKVNFSLRRKDISYWDTTNQTWITPSGTYQVYVGKSVLDLPLTGSFPLA